MHKLIWCVKLQPAERKTVPNDIRTQAIILRRTNYGESDRILNLLTPEGKISALAKSVRKEKSRLAGGIELFSVSDVVIHQGRSNLGTLTSAKMLRFYGNILLELPRLEFASSCLRKVERAAEQTDNPDYFAIMQAVLAALDQSAEMEIVKTWFAFNLARAMGEELNLITDVEGAELNSAQKYFWDGTEMALRADERGRIGSREIKLARMLWDQNLATVLRIQQVAEIILPLTDIARTLQ